MTKHCLSALSDIDAIFESEGRVLLASDFDGTLCPIAASPNEVHVAPATMEILRRMTTSGRLSLAIISGRAITDVASRLPLDVTFAGNHGLEIRGQGILFEHPEACGLRPVLAAACEELKGIVRRWQGAWVENKGLSATVHYRKVEPRHYHGLLFAVRQALGRYGTRFALRSGKKALELRPRISWDKGAALEYIRQNTGPFDACICLGDDRTDEMMFRANRGEINVRVGIGFGPTEATHHLLHCSEVSALLSHILNVSERGTAMPAAMRIAAG